MIKKCVHFMLALLFCLIAIAPFSASAYYYYYDIAYPHFNSDYDRLYPPRSMDPYYNNRYLYPSSENPVSAYWYNQPNYYHTYYQRNYGSRPCYATGTSIVCW